MAAARRPQVPPSAVVLLLGGADAAARLSCRRWPRGPDLDPLGPMWVWAGRSARKAAASPGDEDGGDGDGVVAMEPSCCSAVMELHGPIFGPAGPLALDQRVAAATYVLQRGSGLCRPDLGPAGQRGLVFPCGVRSTPAAGGGGRPPGGRAAAALRF